MTLRRDEDWWLEQQRKRARWQRGSEIRPSEPPVFSNVNQADLRLETPQDPLPFDQAPDARDLTLSLPIPPSVNVRMANHILTKEHREFRRYVAAAVNTYASKKIPLRGRLGAVIVAYPANRQRDSDNFVKPLFDALQHAGVFASGRDNQIREYSVKVVDGTKRDTITITVQEIGS